MNNMKLLGFAILLLLWSALTGIPYWVCKLLFTICYYVMGWIIEVMEYLTNKLDKYNT